MKEYRQNAHCWSLLFWALLCTATAIFIFVHSHHLISRRLRIEETLAGVMLLILGPAALAAYLARARAVWVGLTSDGLVVSGGRLVPWAEIRDVKRRRPVLRKSSGPAQVPEITAPDLPRNVGTGCLDLGCIAGGGELFAVIAILLAAVWAAWLIVGVIVPLLVIPVMEVFVPFGDRITIRTRGRTLVLHDLSDADEFMAKIGSRVRVTRD
jgi:hypothetical protein